MFKALKFVLEVTFRILGIPNPSYDVDLVLAVVFLLVYLVALPAMWFWDELDLFGKISGTTFMTVVLVVCVLSVRSKFRGKRDD